MIIVLGIIVLAVLLFAGAVWLVHKKEMEYVNNDRNARWSSNRF